MKHDKKELGDSFVPDVTERSSIRESLVFVLACIVTILVLIALQ
jgi:hypothetical protein